MKMIGISRHAVLGAALLAVSIVSALSAAAEDPKNADPAGESDVSKHCSEPQPAHCDDPSSVAETTDSAPAAANEPAVTCPCADDFAAAAAAYDARPGIPERPQWDVCLVPRGGVGKYGISMMTKFDALTPSQDGRRTIIFLHAARRWTFWGTHPVECWASVIVDRPRVPKKLFDSAIRDKLSDAELSACETLIRAIAKCPE